MHSKTSEENIHVTQYLQEKHVVVADPNVSLHFLSLPSPSYSKTPSMPHSPRLLQENSKYPRVWERRIERELQNWIDQAYPLILRSLFINEASIFFNFHDFPLISSSRATCDLWPSFYPNSIIFINKMPINSSFLSKSFDISFSNFLSHNNRSDTPLGCFSHHSTWNMCPMTVVLYIFTWIFKQGYYRTLPLGGTLSLVFNDTYKLENVENKTYCPMELYNTACCSIYNDYLLNMTNILFIRAL